MSESAEIQLALKRALEHHGAGRLGPAERIYRRILAVDPTQADALHYLGVIGLQLGRYEDAAGLIEKAVRTRPDNHDALINLGNALQALGRHEEAIVSYEKALTLRPTSAAFLANLGNALAQLGRIDEAIARYEAALGVDPGLTEVRRNLANVLLARGRPDEALKHIRQAASADPAAIEIKLSMGNILCAVGRSDEALTCFEAVLDAHPGAAPVHCNLGNALKELGRLSEAMERYEKALSLDPDYAEGHYCRGLALKDLGDQDAATVEFRRAIALDRRCTKAWAAIAGLSKRSLTNADFQAVSELLQAPDLTPDERMHLEFALGKACEDFERHADAIEHYHRGNRLCRERITYSIEDDRRVFDRIKATFDAGFFERWSDAGVDDSTPIFIIGMPRSGSTLVEQILASHPSVYGGGELALLPRAISKRFPMTDGIDYTEGLATATNEDFAAVAAGYLSAIRELAPPGGRVTDKLLINFLNVGMIRVLFRSARVVHCVRDARDTCFSIYKHYFGARGLDFAYDQEELGHYYNLYADLMHYWNRVLPGFLSELRYESLVREQEATTRALLDACGLPWHAACLEFHRTARPVSTHSAAQVRQPIYRGSIGAWRPYEGSLEPLLNVLSERDP